jgi:hypothetical protein
MDGTILSRSEAPCALIAAIATISAGCLGAATTLLDEGGGEVGGTMEGIKKLDKDALNLYSSR